MIFHVRENQWREYVFAKYQFPNWCFEMSIPFITSLFIFGRVGTTNSWIQILGFRHRGPDSLFDHPYYVNGHRLHSNLAKFHPEYIKFVEDAMLVLFLLCVLITLLVVHRASCYRWEEKREKNEVTRHRVENHEIFLPLNFTSNQFWQFNKRKKRNIVLRLFLREQFCPNWDFA